MNTVIVWLYHTPAGSALNHKGSSTKPALKIKKKCFAIKPLYLSPLNGLFLHCAKNDHEV